MRHTMTTSCGCVLWLGHIMANGYGQIGRGSKGAGSILVHRAAYEIAKGPIPAGMTLDHLCRIRSCVNADHLEAVSHCENLMRGQSFSAVNAAKTHCINGHPFSGVNLKITLSGKRHCRQCDRDRHNRKYRKAQLAGLT